MKKRVLIIDDDAWFTESIGESLKPVAKIGIISNLDETFSAIDEFNPEIILLDFALGDKNAITLLNEFASYSDLKIPIFLISSLANNLKLSDFAKFGVEKIIDKSEITPKKLRNLITNWRGDE